MNLMNKEKKKKDNIVRKGYSTFVQNQEKQKVEIAAVLEKHGVKKEKVEIKVVVPESVTSINKKEKVDLTLESDKDSLFIKVHETQEQKTTGATTATGKKKYIANSELKFRGKRHRGINVPIEELPQRQPRPPKQNNNQNNQNNTNAQTEQTQTDQTANENKSDSPNQNQNRNWNSNNRGGNRGGYRGGKGSGKRIHAEDFPSLGDAVVSDEKPQWVQDSN